MLKVNARSKVSILRNDVVFQVISTSFRDKITIKTMAFGTDADIPKLTRLATVGGGEFSEAVCIIFAYVRFLFTHCFIMTEGRSSHSQSLCRICLWT